MPEEASFALKAMNHTNDLNQAIADLRQAGAIDPAMERAAQWLKPRSAASTNLKSIEGTTTLPTDEEESDRQGTSRGVNWKENGDVCHGRH